ncbi:hypothetical protein AS4_12120 [Acinetobacter guillouiae]|nr:hypothetical protein AS4_12120 [Acinetobacter guillouiae]
MIHQAIDIHYVHFQKLQKAWLKSVYFRIQLICLYQAI